MMMRDGLAIMWMLMLTGMAVSLVVINFSQQLAPQLWWQAASTPVISEINQMLFHYSLLPRTVLAILVGAGLALAGVLFQQVLRNPLAEPTTLGVSAGAQLGLTIATLWLLPGGEAIRQLATITGAIVIGLLVFGVAWGRRLSPITLILAGLVLGLYSGALKSLLVLFNLERLQNIFLWSSGMLNQYDWSMVKFLWLWLLLAIMLTLLMLRPLTLLALDEGITHNLGLRLMLSRLAALSVAIILSAMLVRAAGIIGFIGLFAPLLAKMLGVRRLLPRLVMAMLLGALLLLISDQLMILLARSWRDIPTGAATALIGAPLLLWLLPRLRHLQLAPDRHYFQKNERQLTVAWLIGSVMFLILFSFIALGFGKDINGWYWSWSEMLRWRWPRMLSAIAAGAMLAAAGTLVQKLTGNPMASPEVLGVSSGAAFGVVLLIFLLPGDTSAWLLPAGALGAGLTLVLITILANRGGFSTHRLLLVGIALSTVFSTLLTLLLVSGDPRMGSVLVWLAGSTYRISPYQALLCAMLAVLLLSLTPLFRRWLAILPLGSASAQSVGMALKPSRWLLLILSSGLIATATLSVGPLSFVGLMAPHMARLLGFKKALPQLWIASILGAIVMLVADWVGRTILFPYQIPAGLLATFLGAPYFIYLLRKQAN